MTGILASAALARTSERADPSMEAMTNTLHPLVIMFSNWAIWLLTSSSAYWRSTM